MRIRFVYLLFPFFAVAGAGGAMPDGWSRVQLMPREEGSWGACSSALRQVEDPELKATAETQSFAKWTVFEDEYIRFRYPDHPDIKLEIKLPKDRIPISGGAVGTTDHSFSKSYRLAVGEHTYGLLMLSGRNEFDDGFCLCGAVAFQKYLFRNGALFRFDFLYNGNVKKIQMLGDGVRAVLFEWTHMPMTQAVYSEFALGVELKAPVRDEVAMRAMVSEKYGVAGRLGFLEKGMSRTEILSLLGKPVCSSESELVYEHIEDRWRDTFTIVLEDGVFRGLQKGWRKEDKLPAERGTVEWIMETIEAASPEVFGSDIEPQPIDEETMKYIFDRFAEIGPTVDGDNWDGLCMWIGQLEEKGCSDDRIASIVRNRFLERGVGQHHAAWLLHKNDPENSQDLFAARIRLSLDETRAIDADDFLGPYADIGNLLFFLKESDPRRKVFILEAVNHPHEDIRLAGYYKLDDIPTDESLPHMRRGLSESEVYSRQCISNYFAEFAGSRADLPLLREQMENEKNEEVRENLENAIKRLESLPSN